MYFFITLTTAIALSLDAFSLAIIYGTIIKDKKILLSISMTVGLFHFFMPLFGYFTSNLLILKILPSTNVLSFDIFIILGLEMIFGKNDDELLNLSKLPNILLFAFTVSLDSFSVGIAISSRNEAIILPIFLFSITSFLFTYVGLMIGKNLNGLFGKYTNIIGGILLILLSFYYLFT